jgi:spore coat polysaccharide biosynthesis protein SpsF
MKIGGIIQARMGSTRFPEKILKKLNEKTVLEHIVKRVNDSGVDICIVATTLNPRDDIVEEFCRTHGVACFRGSEDDVLERYYQAASHYQLDVIVRITADDPLKDSEVIKKAIDLLLKGKYDYVSNTIKPTYPEGIDVEVFTYAVLEKAYQEADLPSEHEHVTPYIWKNRQIFSTYNFENEIDLSGMRWTMDTEDDYRFMQRVYSNFVGRDNFSMGEVLEYLSKNPDILKINQGHIRNEGYLKSIEKEQR